MIVKKTKKLFEFIAIKIIQKYREKIYKYKEEKIKYLFYSNIKSDKLIIVFSACTRTGIRARYNYVRTLRKIKANKLFILDDGGVDHRGTYYLGKYPDFNFEKATKKLIEVICKKMKPVKIIFVGSSKGGWAALNFGLEYDNSSIICGAPQYYIGTYLNNMNGKVTIKSIGCNTKKSLKYVDYYLKNKINNKKNNIKIYMQYSDNDPTYTEQIKYLIEDLKNKKYNLEEDVLDYKNHNDVSLYFPNYILRTMKRINGGDGVEK